MGLRAEEGESGVRQPEDQAWCLALPLLGTGLVLRRRRQAEEEFRGLGLRSMQGSGPSLAP